MYCILDTIHPKQMSSQKQPLSEAGSQTNQSMSGYPLQSRATQAK